MAQIVCSWKTRPLQQSNDWVLEFVSTVSANMQSINNFPWKNQPRKKNNKKTGKDFVM